MPLALVPLLALLPTFAPPAEPPDRLRTVAERSGFRATSLHRDVVDLLDALEAVDGDDGVMTRLSLGTSVEGRDLPLVTLADPPARTAAEARAGGRLIVFVLGNIHAGEVCGKEALLMLAREIVTERDRPDVRALLERLVLVFAPIYNADGNERVDVSNRPGQVGPADGMGVRPNAQGLDLNRDHVKLESPEARAQVRFLTDWDPDLVIDTHTTNGSIHRFVLTYAAPQNPSAHPAPLEWTRDVLLPAVSKRLEARTGDRTFFYGNLDRARTRWTTYSSQPRFGAPYRGLRGHLSILSEAYAYASYEERVRATLEFVRECAAYVAEHADTVRELRERARRETVWNALKLAGRLPVGLRHEVAAFDGTVSIPSELATRGPDGRWRTSGVPVTWLVAHHGRFEPTITTTLPRGYLVPPGLDAVVEKLRQHGIVVRPVDAESEGPLEVDRIDEIARDPRAFQGHHLVRLEVTRRTETRRVGPGWWRVDLAQPLGTLALYLLESRSDDGLVTWNLLDPWLEAGADYPILRDVGGN
ncbi:MAG: M14 family metallopeptidase [Planctomycetota bacterium JB042]